MKTQLEHFEENLKYLDYLEEHDVWPLVEALLKHRSGAGGFGKLQERTNATLKFLRRARDVFRTVKVGDDPDVPPAPLVFFALSRVRVLEVALRVAYICAKEAQVAVTDPPDRAEVLVRLRHLNSTARRLEDIADWVKEVERDQGLLRRFRRLFSRLRGQKPEMDLADLDSQVDAVHTCINELANIGLRLSWFESRYRVGVENDPEELRARLRQMAWRSASETKWPDKVSRISPGVAADFIASLATAELLLASRASSSGVVLTKAVLATCRSNIYLRSMVSCGKTHPEYSLMFVNADSQKARAIACLNQGRRVPTRPTVAFPAAGEFEKLYLRTDDVRQVIERAIENLKQAGEAVMGR